MLQYINIPIFIFSFIIGLIIIYIFGPEKKIVYIYPTPYNQSKYQFKDNADNCYVLKSNKASCPINPLSVKTIPVQN